MKLPGRQTTPHKILVDLVNKKPKIKVADIAAFIAHYSRFDESALSAEIAQVREMFGFTQKKQAPTPPAGLRAKEAVPIVLAYVREEKGQPVSLSKEERGSFSALVDALDRRFGTGFAQRVIDELNAMPNGSRSLHYKR